MSLDNFCKVFMPYCVRRNGDGTVSILNREYSDLGTAERVYPPVSRYRMRMTEKMAIEVAHDSGDWRGRDPVGDVFWLYDDATQPWTSDRHWLAYTVRLRRLAHLKVRPATSTGKAAK